MSKPHPLKNSIGYDVTNRHLYPLTETNGWIFCDSIITTKCPKCHCAPGFYCQQPSSRKTWPPHVERTTVYIVSKRSAVSHV